MATGDKLVNLDELKLAYDKLHVPSVQVQIPTGQWSGSSTRTYTVNATNVTADTIVDWAMDSSINYLKADLTVTPGSGTVQFSTTAIPAGTINVTLFFPGVNGEVVIQTLADVYSKSQVDQKISQSTAYVTEYVNIGAEDMLAKIAQMSANKMIYFRTTGTTTNGPRSGIYLIGTAVRAGNNITITASEMLYPETIYQNSTNNAGSTWAGWSGIGCAVFNSTTPGTVYATLSSIGIGKSMPFIITNSDAASFLTGGKSTSLLKGIVARTGTTGTQYDFIGGQGGNQYMYTWRVTAESASSITPGTVYRYTGTTI